MAPAAPAPAAPAAPNGIRPISVKPPVPVAAPDVTAQAAKGKTSRISLDAAMFAQPSGAAAPAMGRMTTNLSTAASAMKGQTSKIAAGASADSQPTIKLQKPAAADSEAPTLKLKPLSLKTPAGAPPPAAASDAEDSKPTLRLKTAGGAPKPAPKAAEAAAPVNPMGSDIEAPPSVFGGAPLLMGKKEKVGVVFPLVAAVAVVALGYLSLVLMSQACGPDEGSLTRLSSFPGLPSFPVMQRYVSR